MQTILSDVADFKTSWFDVVGILAYVRTSLTQ